MKKTSWQRWLLLGALTLARAAAAQGNGDWALVQNGTAVLFRHANAPGVGDPPQFRLDDCSTQRNLDNVGREQAARIGHQFRQRGIEVKTVWSSRWCGSGNCRLAFPGLRRDQPAFDSQFRTATAALHRPQPLRPCCCSGKARGCWSSSVTRSTSAADGHATASGEGVVVKAEEGRLKVLGTVQP
jgi:hypothetical protein